MGRNVSKNEYLPVHHGRRGECHDRGDIATDSVHLKGLRATKSKPICAFVALASEAGAYVKPPTRVLFHRQIPNFVLWNPCR
jgi:hypothetical protein